MGTFIFILIMIVAVYVLGKLFFSSEVGSTVGEEKEPIKSLSSEEAQVAYPWKTRKEQVPAKGNYEFVEQFGLGIINKTIKTIPKNVFLKKLISGEELTLKSYAQKGGACFLYSTDKGRAVGMTVLHDDVGHIMVDAVFDLKISENNTIKLSQDWNCGMLELSRFKHTRKLSIDYYKEPSSRSVYKIENVSITLK